MENAPTHPRKSQLQAESRWTDLPLLSEKLSFLLYLNWAYLNTPIIRCTQTLLQNHDWQFFVLCSLAIWSLLQKYQQTAFPTRHICQIESLSNNSLDVWTSDILHPKWAMSIINKTITDYYYYWSKRLAWPHIWLTCHVSPSLYMTDLFSSAWKLAMNLWFYIDCFT